MHFTLAILVFLTVAVVFFLLASLVDARTARARLIRERLEDAQRAAAGQATPDLTLLRDEMLSQIPAVDTLLRRSARISHLQDMLSQASINSRAGNFLMLCVAWGVAFGAFLSVLSPPAYAVFLGWTGAVVGFFIPFSYLSYRRRKRFEKFEELFPEAIDTLARAVRAGHAFTTALELITAEIAEPVAGEFRKLYEEQKFGMPVRDALFNLVSRVPLVDVKFFITAVTLQRETGGNLAEILDKLSYLIRERFKILRQVRVYTAQGRLTMMLLMALPPLIVAVMLVLSPGFIRPLFTDPIGQKLLLLGGFLQFIGFFFIRRVIRIQV
jgi:tight adherence protein B